ncbi:peroxisomal membrane protein 11C [Drosophila biarmipes]|uniref:peroxisomal membrane protein 11C-like n=1 Tax=Drosophila biarmipes TaxID=125945 RepID=UPI0007E6C249|nr:peroxisomal membrane protein 11C-like [Drosophila biarmipes]XP_050744233.1 peroxisomal membrane protein 11C [Drosophila biarmipes]
MFINEVCGLIGSYGGRDVLMEALCQGAKLAAGYQAKRNPDLSQRCATVSSKISGAQATLRLIEDLPVIQYTLDYGLGECEPDRITAVLGVMSNAVDLLFYPIETICWLAENRVLDVRNRTAWSYANSIFCVLSVYLNLVRTLRTFSLKRNQLSRQDAVSLARISLDLVHAVGILPRGYLWGGKMSTLQIGAIGTLSAALGIYQVLARKRLTK